jgi:hypothetical protein
MLAVSFHLRLVVMDDTGNDRYLRHLALEIATQLPETEERALLVLDYARELVTGFLAGATEKEARAATVLTIVARQ